MGHPGIGLRMLMGHVRGKGFRIQWEKTVRQSLLRTDPLGVHQRWRESIHHHVYRVYGPLALWHINGNHKLIRCSPHFTIIVTNDNNIIIPLLFNSFKSTFK